jgi:hypothetical protein
MKKFIIFLFFSFIITSCKKQKEVKVVKNITDLNEMFQLKNYKAQTRMKVNDSIDHIKARLNDFTLTGDFDTKMKNKTGIWTLRNRLDSKEVQIDYIIFDKNDVFKNQIIFKEHNKIDSSMSKFFIIKDKTQKELVMKFFSPKMKDEISKKAKIKYTIHRNRKEIKTDSIVYGNVKEGKYLSEIKYDFKKGDDVAGYFSEFVMAKDLKNKDSIIMGNNSIYFIEKFE